MFNSMIKQGDTLLLIKGEEASFSEVSILQGLIVKQFSTFTVGKN